MTNATESILSQTFSYDGRRHTYDIHQALHADLGVRLMVILSPYVVHRVSDAVHQLQRIGQSHAVQAAVLLGKRGRDAERKRRRIEKREEPRVSWYLLDGLKQLREVGRPFFHARLLSPL